MMKVIQDFKNALNKERKVLKRTQSEIEMELKNSISKLETQRKALHVE